MEERKKCFICIKVTYLAPYFIYKKYLSISFYILKNLYICTQYTKAIRYT